VALQSGQLGAMNQRTRITLPRNSLTVSGFELNHRPASHSGAGRPISSLPSLLPRAAVLGMTDIKTDAVTIRNAGVNGNSIRCP
jgi:hypothetical protein